MHGVAILIKKIRCGTYFIENEKEEEHLYTLHNEKKSDVNFVLALQRSDA